MIWLIFYVIGCALTLFLAYAIGLGAGRRRPLFGYGFGAVLLAMSIWLGLRAAEIASHIWPGLFDWPF